MWDKIKWILSLLVSSLLFILYTLFVRERGKRIELEHKLKSEKIKAETGKQKAQIQQKKALIDRNWGSYKKAVEKQRLAEKRIEEIDKKLEKLKMRGKPEDTDEEWKKRGF